MFAIKKWTSLAVIWPDGDVPWCTGNNRAMIDWRFGSHLKAKRPPSTVLVPENKSQDAPTKGQHQIPTVAQPYNCRKPYIQTNLHLCCFSLKPPRWNSNWNFTLFTHSSLELNGCIAWNSQSLQLPEAKKPLQWFLDQNMGTKNTTCPEATIII